MENHEYNLGHDWYSKARDRGAPETSINADLRSILLKLDKAKSLKKGSIHLWVAKRLKQIIVIVS